MKAAARVERSAAIRQPAPAVTDPYAALAPYYDLLAPDAGDDLDLYADLAQRSGGAVLELGTGTGRLLVPLAMMGYTVTGIDQSEAMLAIARQRAEAAHTSVELVRAGMTDYRLARRFGLVICAHDTFLHLTEQEQQLQALRLAAGCLAPRGCIVLDLPALGGEWGAWEPGVRPLELAWSGESPSGERVQHFTTFVADAARQVRTVTHLIDVIGTGGVVRRLSAEFSLRFIAPGELPLLVQAAGLHLADIWGDYDRAPFTADSRRMLALIKE